MVVLKKSCTVYDVVVNTSDNVGDLLLVLIKSYIICNLNA
jgi:hypothetical protein